MKSMKHKWNSSLRYKQLLVLVLGTAVSFGMYFSSQAFGDYLITRNHLNEEAVSKRTAVYLDSFEKYIDKNHLSVKNVKAISKWVKNHKYIYLTVFNGRETIYESGFWNETYSSYESGSPVLRDISFADGTYSVSVIDSSGIRWYSLVRFLSWGISFLVLFAILLFYNQRIIARILLLSKEVSLIEQGDLDQPILYKGNDELSLLARNADNMRRSIITRYRSEKEAWEANSELITSMSHDIRTPLTSLIGYLEILDSKSCRSEEQLEKYIKSCKEKSIQLKDLSDELFQYFLVFGKEKIQMKPETFDAEILFSQILAEHVFDLNNSGFSSRMESEEKSCTVTVDIKYLKRLFDNLFSNVKKYADPEEPVVIVTRLENGYLSAGISNTIGKNSLSLESTGIGLKTCGKIAAQMNGTFETQKTDRTFKAVFTLPAQPAEERTNP